MATAEEVGSVAVFAGLAEADRERVARAAADTTLAPGEYAAHEGGEWTTGSLVTDSPTTRARDSADV